MELSGKRILLGMTGGIACYKVADLARQLTKAGASVQVAMTQAATQFITPVTMQALTGHEVFTDQWDARIPNNMPHIDLTRDIDAILIAPCSADFIFKLVHGACDDLLSTLCLARPRNLPLLIAPAMNVEMWQNAATRRNVQRAREDGIMIFGPEAGEQACGESGMGRMLEPEQLLEEVVAAFQPKVLLGKRVMITAGPTFEPIDPVRGITNLSSGKMGYAIARAAREGGAEVMLISGPTALNTPSGVQRINVQTAQQMYEVVMSHISDQDIYIGVAAVADWRIANVSEQKLKKSASDELPVLEFELNPDILAEVAQRPNPPYCVGFAAESELLLKHGEEKRQRKQVPLLVGNIGHRTFGKDENELVLFDEHGHKLLPLAEKQKLARLLVAEIARRLPESIST